MPRTARPRSRTATLGVRTGDAYAIDEKTSGKVDATDGGLHVQHGVPESPDPQLTLGIDVTLKPDQVRELLARLEGEMGAPVHDAGRGGFQVDVTQLSGERLIVHGHACKRRSGPEIAQQVSGHLSRMIGYSDVEWLKEALPPLAPLIGSIRWFDGQAKKRSKSEDRPVLLEELARVAWCRVEGQEEQGDQVAGDDGCADSTPQPRGERDSRLFLASPLGRGELRRMRDSAALAAVAGEETAPTAGAKRRRERDEAAVAAKKSKVEVKARAKAAAAGERAASLKEGAALKRKAVEERAASRKEASLIRQAAAAAERTAVRTQPGGGGARGGGSEGGGGEGGEGSGGRGGACGRAGAP